MCQLLLPLSWMSWCTQSDVCSVCLFYIDLSFTAFLFVSLLSFPLTFSRRTPVTRFIDLWSCVSSLTGVTSNIHVFTASVCMEWSPPHEIHWRWTGSSFPHIRKYLQCIFFLKKVKCHLVVWGEFRVKCYWKKMFGDDKRHSCVSAFYGINSMVLLCFELLIVEVTKLIRGFCAQFKVHTEWSEGFVSKNQKCT